MLTPNLNPLLQVQSQLSKVDFPHEMSRLSEAQGFKKEIRRGITLQVQDRVPVEFALQVGSWTEVVDIQAETPLVQTESSASEASWIADRSLLCLSTAGITHNWPR